MYVRLTPTADFKHLKTSFPSFHNYLKKENCTHARTSTAWVLFLFLILAGKANQCFYVRRELNRNTKHRSRRSLNYTQILVLQSLYLLEPFAEFCFFCVYTNCTPTCFYIKKFNKTNSFNIGIMAITILTPPSLIASVR